MFVRKNRSHASGVSNLAARANTLESVDRLNGTKTPNNELKVKRHADLLLRRLNTDSSPTRTTENFYSTQKKKMRTKTEVGYPRTAQLEEVDKRKPVFTGESEILFDKKLEKYREWEAKIEPISSLLPATKKANLIKEKHNVHGNAVQETQLVGYDKYSNDTLKNNVNLEKVREARRILRRRYANRANLQRIYAAWDDDRTGTINHKNVFNMSKKLGLNLNVDEARVLLASANRSGTGELTIDEFLDLIYNKDDALNVDLDQLSSNLDANYLVKREELYGDESNILKKLQEDAQKTRENRHNNQVSLVLRNKLNSIAQFLLIADSARLGYLNYDKFHETVKRLGINDQIVSDADIRRLFYKYSEDQHTTNYRLLVEDLKAFRFRHEDMYTEIKIEKEKKKIIDPQEIIDEEVVISDCKTAPFNFVMNYIEKSEKINTGIKRYFPSKNELKDYIAEKFKVEKEGIENQPLSQKELKDFVIGLFKNFDNSIVTKEHFDGFLSSFMYNAHGFTNVNELLETVYEGTDKTHFAKLAKLKPNAPPHAAIAKIPEGSDLVEGSEDDYGMLPKIRSNTEGDVSSKEFNIDTDKKLKRILHKLDNQLFINNNHQYDLFKNFDKDNDGYVSHKDFARRINELSLLNKHEIPRLLEYLDPENKGYVNFQEFNKRIHANMTNANSFNTLRSPSNMYPTKEFNQKTVPNIKGYTTKINEVVKKTHPYYQYNLNCTTRYGSSPTWSNTFSHMQAATHSPMFISEEQRFDKQHQQRVVFQKDEQMKKKMIETSRVNSLKSSINFFTEKIEKENIKLEKLTASNMAKKTRERELYDQRAKLRNEVGN